MIPRILTLGTIAGIAVVPSAKLSPVPTSGIFGGIGIGFQNNSHVVEIFIPDYLNPELFSVVYGKRLNSRRSMFDMSPHEVSERRLRRIIRSFLI